MKLIDSHAHLDHIENLDQVLEDAYKEGVQGIVAVSIDLASCRKNLEIKKKYSKPEIPRLRHASRDSAQDEGSCRPLIYLACGMHPSDADLGGLDACVDFIRDQREELTAIGEIGLDFWYKWARKDKEKKDEQRAIFRTFLELAKELDLPAVIHTRGTWRECFETTKEVGITKAEFHWYSGPLDVLKDILDQGYYVSTSPSVAYSPQSREAMSYAPIDRTMIETDSPVFYKNRDADDGFQSTPKDVFRTLKAYCALKNLDEEKSAEILNQNARDFFHLD